MSSLDKGSQATGSPESQFLNQLLADMRDLSSFELGKFHISVTAKLVKDYWKANQSTIACHNGCNHCCHFMVGISSAEAVAIYYYIMTHWHRDQIDEYVARLKQRVELIKGMDQKQYFEAVKHKGCLFLGSYGECKIYETRPRACSTLLAKEVEPCKTQGVGPQHSAPKTIGMLGYIALIGELKRRKLQSGIYEMNQALLTLFTSITAAQDWANGEKIFKDNLHPELDEKIHLQMAT